MHTTANAGYGVLIQFTPLCYYHIFQDLVSVLGPSVSPKGWNKLAEIVMNYLLYEFGQISLSCDFVCDCYNANVLIKYLLALVLYLFDFGCWVMPTLRFRSINDGGLFGLSIQSYYTSICPKSRMIPLVSLHRAVYLALTLYIFLLLYVLEAHLLPDTTSNVVNRQVTHHYNLKPMIAAKESLGFNLLGYHPFHRCIHICFATRCTATSVSVPRFALTALLVVGTRPHTHPPPGPPPLLLTIS